MAIDREIARLARILVDTKKISFDEAQRRLRGMTLEIIVGLDAVSPAAHAAILTAVSVGRRTFTGGVRVRGTLDQELNSALPLSATRLGDAVIEVGASEFDGSPSRRILVGTNSTSDGVWSIATWWRGWRAGASMTERVAPDGGENPLVGIAAAALAVGKAFEAERGVDLELDTEINLWPSTPADLEPPLFGDLFLPNAFWLIGLGNLGQAFLWALAALPYVDPSAVSIFLHDYDKITPENWATSVLVLEERYGLLKTRVGEALALAKGFDTRRIDRRLLPGDRLDDNDPRLALSGVDKIEARRLVAAVGFDCIVDAGLGRTATEFDRYRVTVFDREYPIDKHFADQVDRPADDLVPEEEAYRRLEAELGRCGTVEIAGASVSAPYVSALASTVAISRTIAIASGCECVRNEVGKLSNLSSRRVAPSIKIKTRGIGHAGHPKRWSR
jgi:hypothetical protein